MRGLLTLRSRKPASSDGDKPVVPPRRWLAAGVAVAVVLGAVALLLGRQLFSPASTATTTTSPERRAQPADELVEFRDAKAGFSISHPSGWRRIPSPDTDVSLLAAGDGVSMLVRTSPLRKALGPKELRTAKNLTNELVREVGRVNPLRAPARVRLGGAPGYLYLYTYVDGESAQGGGHAHYFLFHGKTMLTIVFQAVPASRFAPLAPLFDRIAATLRFQRR